MVRTPVRSPARPIIAYDLETTRIAEGTPTVTYLTAYGPRGFKISAPLVPRATKKRDATKALGELLRIVEAEFLTDERKRTRYVAWNGNGYDVFFIARALLMSDRWILRPYLTRSKALRGLKVIDRLDSKRNWEFLDGMSMTGLDAAKMKLEKFVSMFAPQYPKLAFDFSTMEFDPYDAEHIKYADRDSEALWHAMIAADEIVERLTGGHLAPTMGNLAIKYFQSQIPEHVISWKAPREVHTIMSGPAKRGGYCWAAKQYEGKVWGYDINQAYAAAMRDAKLPSGTVFETSKQVSNPSVYLCTFWREKPSLVPFYYRHLETGTGLFTTGKNKATSWILSTEVEHLQRDGWRVDIERGYGWRDSFNMREMVDKLEHLRFSDPGGPSGALGTMVKQIGNSSYGKTLETLDGVEYVLSMTRPGDDYMRLGIDDTDDAQTLIWRRDGEAQNKPYHRPQIGAFITAHVRIVVREAALGDAKHFLYADTDGVKFSRPVKHLDVDPRRYGAWKEEITNKDYILIGKKIYFGAPDEKGGLNHRAKGLHIRELTEADFRAWLAGKPPKQRQTQRQNFIKFVGGRDMFNSLDRRGTDVHKSKTVAVVDGAFIPV